jgi:hypothetical protein
MGGRLAAIDPLLALLQRYQVERKAFDDASPTEGITDQDWDRIAEVTWSGTQDQIIQSEPPATTAAGALLALDHVLQSDDLFFDRSESVDLQMLWLLIKAARDYIALVEMHDPPQVCEGDNRHGEKILLASGDMFADATGKLTR